MFVLEVVSFSWCSQLWFTQASISTNASSLAKTLGPVASAIFDLPVLSISCGTIFGILLGSLLTITWLKRKQQLLQSIGSSPLISPEKSNNALAARTIQCTIKDLISSQYVMKDREQFTSVLQTPLRVSIEKLRLVADSLGGIGVTTASIDAWSSVDTQQPYRRKSQLAHCDVVAKVAEQVGLMKSLQANIIFQHFDTTGFTPILPICSSWFAATINELLVNVVKQNKQINEVNVGVHTSVQGTNFIVCVTDNGIGISGNITRKLNALDIKHSSDSFPTLFVDSEAVNLATIKNRVEQLNGLLEIYSARHFLTKVVLTLPLAGLIEQVAVNVQQSKVATIQSKEHENLPILLIIRIQNTAPLYKLLELAERFTFIFAESIDDGLSILSLQKPDCVLLDIETTEANATSLNHWLDQSNEIADVPLVLLENEVAENRQYSELQIGVSAVLDKFANANDIAIIIDKAIYEKQRILEQVSEGLANYHLHLADTNNIDDLESIKFVESFTLVLQQNYAIESFNRPDAAKLMLMTEKTLARRLNHHYKLGFAEKLRQFRLHAAKEFLTSGVNVTTTAYDCGFNTPSYFAQCFRAEFGFAPSMLCKHNANTI